MIWINARSDFSIGESLLKPSELVDLAIKAGAHTVALTDTMRLSSMADFTKAAKAKGVKPIVGARLRIVDELTHDKASKKHNKPYYLRVLVRTEAGYRALLKLLSMGFDKEHFYEVPRLLLADVASVLGAAGNDASIITLGDFYSAHAAGKAPQVVAAMRAAGVAVVSEIVPIPLPHFIRQAHEALELAKSEGIECVVGVPALYQESEHALTQDLMRVIATPGMKMQEWSAKHVWRDFTGKTGLDSARQMQTFCVDMAKHYPEHTVKEWLEKLAHAWRNNQIVADTCTYVWEKDPPSLPVMASDEFKAVAEACQRGWAERFARPIYGHKPDDLTPYRDRLKYELGILRKLKFEGYFLLVAEIVNWSKENGIRVGPGRGSVGGSLVAYLMGITDIDPLRFDLLFERFINPDRIDLPDADLDFMGTRRDQIVGFIKAKYGEDRVAAVSNYMKLLPAQTLKSLCRVLDVPEATMAFGKLVPKEHGQSYKLDQAIAEMPELEKFARENPTIIKHARVLEDRMSGYGKHAAGIVVAQKPIHELAVVETREGEPIINWDKRLVEDFGLVKIDILGLSTLDMIDITQRHIFSMHGKKIDLHDIELDDTSVLEAFGRGETVGVFQFESYGIRKLLKDMADQAPLTFEDITAATALYRPGPMDSGQLTSFVEIKQGLKLPSYLHPSMEKALANTYGVIVYQEQVMQVAVDFAGFTLVQADHLRKIMGKKEKDKMKEWRDKFVAGAVNTHGVTEPFAGEIFDIVEKFAGYGFNKSHASAYALISYITMWLKVKYPIEFFGGLFTMVKSDRWGTVLGDMRRLGLSLQSPDINISSDIFEPLTSTTLLAPFNAIKGISDKTAHAIMEAREKDGPYQGIADLEKRVSGRLCHTGHRQKLDLVGAFARVELAQLPADHHSRKRDQIELLGGLIDGAVIIDRPLELTGNTVDGLNKLIEGYKGCDLCELKGLCHPKPWITGPAKVMLVVDGPNYRDEALDQIEVSEFVEEALTVAGIGIEEVYLTSLVKSPKPEGTKEWSNKTLAECPVWLEREIALLKPPVIVALGSKSANYLIKDMKGGVTQNAGRVVFDKARDANIVIGFSPGMIFHHGDKQQELNDILSKVTDLLPTT